MIIKYGMHLPNFQSVPPLPVVLGWTGFVLCFTLWTLLRFEFGPGTSCWSPSARRHALRALTLLGCLSLAWIAVTQDVGYGAGDKFKLYRGV